MKPKNRSSFVSSIVLATGSILASVTLAHAAQTWTGATSADWNTATNWTSAVPTGSDVATFDSTSTANLATTLSAASPVAGITVTNPATAVSVTATNTAFAPFAGVTAANATDLFTYAAAAAHPLANGDRVAFTGTLPTGVVAATAYFVINASATNFQVSTTAGGPALNFTTDSAAMFVDGLILPANATDTFAFGAAVYSAPLANGSLVSFTAGTGPAGVVLGANYYVVNSTATTFQVATAAGGSPIDFTTDGATVRAFPNNTPKLTVGSSGFNLSAATFGLTVASPVIVSSPQTWDVAAGQALTVSGAILSTAEITKAGAGALVLTNSNQLTAGVKVNAGSLVTRNGIALLNSTVTLGNGSTYRYERQGNASTFQGQALSVGSASTTITTDNAANGYSGQISGSDDGIVNIGAVGALVQCSFNAGVITNGVPNEQFGNFYGTVRITDGASLRFSATSLNNGGSQSIWDTGLTGNITTRNGGTLHLGELKGAGTIIGASAAAGTANIIVGEKGTDSVFAGVISSGNATDRIAALTKAGSGKLSLTGSNTYTGATTVTSGILEFNNAKSGGGATTVGSDGTLGGSGSIAGTTTVAKDGHLAPGDSAVANGIGALNHSNLTLATGSVVNIEFAGGIHDKVVVATGGTLALNPGIIINPTIGKTSDANPFTTNGTYPILRVAGVTVTGFNSSTFLVPDNGSGKSFTFVTDGNDISLVVSDSTADPSNHWIFDGNGSWNVASRWSKGTVPNAPGAFANFGGGAFALGTSLNVTLDGNRTVGELTFNDGFSSVVTIAQGSSGSLLLDNGTQASNIVSILGDHFITAPVSVDAEGVAVDVGSLATLGLNGVIGGAGKVTKTGTGVLTLAGTNTFSGGLVLQGGITKISNRANLGAGTTTFTGGTLVLGADFPADSSVYQIGGTANAIIDTNTFAQTITTGIAPLAGATGGLTKTGAGTLTLTAASSYTGTTTVTTGVLDIPAGGSVLNGTSFGTSTTAGALLSVSGGAISASADSFIGSGSAGLLVSAGTATFNGGLSARTNSSSNFLISVTGGTLNASSLTMGRGGLNYGAAPAAGSETAGFHMTGGTANISGAMNIGYVNGSVQSSVSARIDGGSLTVGGPVLITVNNAPRWSVLDINGGTFASTDAATGLQIGHGTQFGSAEFLVRAGTAAAERILLQQAAGSTSTSLLNVTGGSLYVGGGGIVGNANGGAAVLTATFGAATLGATADWSSALPLSVAGTTFQAASATAVPHNIQLSGAIAGTDLIKTGAGVLSLSGVNTYTGVTTVSAGTLRVNGNSSAASGGITVAVGATLGGTGIVGGAVAVDGSLAPGSPTGTLTVPSATFNTGAALEVTLDGTASPQNGKLVATGALDISKAKLKITSSGVLTQPTYVIARYATLTGSQFVSIEGLPTGATINYHYNDGVDSNNIAISVPVIGSGYASWSADPLNGLTAGVNDGPGQDPDRDGIANLLEFVLGGNPSVSSSAILPVLTLNATDFVFTFKRADASEAEAPVTFEWSNTLAAWPNAVPIGAAGSSAANGVVVTIEEGTPSTGPDTVTVRVPRSNAVSGKIFGRLKAVK